MNEFYETRLKNYTHCVPNIPTDHFDITVISMMKLLG